MSRIYLIDFIHTRRDESRARVWDAVHPDLAVITSEERRYSPKIELQFLGTLRQILNQLVDRRSTIVSLP